MSWLVWRQYRASTAITGVLIGLYTVLLVITGLAMARQFHADFGVCLAANNCRFPSDNASLGSGLIGAMVEFSLAVPAILGMFLGAPAVAREVETGTAHFAWTQAVTRRHWLTVKTGTFDVQGIMPAAYSLFAMALGIAAGTLIRRMLPALGVTLGVFFAVRLMIMGWVRQHYLTPITSTSKFSQDVILPPKGAAWILGQGFSGPNGPLVIPGGDVQVIGNGFPVADVPAVCHTYVTRGGSQVSSRLFPCLTSHGYSQYITYQPAARYWPFQFIEAGIFVALAAVLIAVAFAVINRRDA